MEDYAKNNTEEYASSHLSWQGRKARHNFHSGGVGCGTVSEDKTSQGGETEEQRGINFSETRDQIFQANVLHHESKPTSHKSLDKISQPLNFSSYQNQITTTNLSAESAITQKRIAEAGNVQPPVSCRDSNMYSSDDASVFYEYGEVESAITQKRIAEAGNVQPPVPCRDSNMYSSDDASVYYEYGEVESAMPINTGTRNEQPPVSYQHSRIPSSDGSSFYVRSSLLETLLDTGISTNQPLAVMENPYIAVTNSLKASARCEENNCDDAICKEIKGLLFDIETHWKNCLKPLTDIHKTVLMCMYEHFKSCHTLPCTFPWCCPQLCESLRETLTKEQIIAHLCQWIASPVSVAVAGQEISLKNLIKLNDQIKFDSAPKEGQAWLSLCMMGQFSKARLVKPLFTSMTEPEQFWVLKRPVCQNSESAWEVYIQLAKFKNLQSITPLLWVAKLTDPHDGLIVCSALEGMCLEEYLHCGEYLTSELVVKIMKKLTVALKHLHSMELVYLNWTSKNILIHQNLGGDMSVKLINFDASAIAGKEMDGSQLPVHLLPPEILNEKTVTLCTDVWGLGCLLFELTTRRPVWHEYRHKSEPELKDVMMKQVHPRLPDVYWSLKPLYKLCWQVDPSRRATVDILHRLLVQY